MACLSYSFMYIIFLYYKDELFIFYTFSGDEEKQLDCLFDKGLNKGDLGDIPLESFL